jgi:hypothetical protein
MSNLILLFFFVCCSAFADYRVTVHNQRTNAVVVVDGESSVVCGAGALADYWVSEFPSGSVNCGDTNASFVFDESGGTRFDLFVNSAAVTPIQRKSDYELFTFGFRTALLTGVSVFFGYRLFRKFGSSAPPGIE